MVMDVFTRDFPPSRLKRNRRSTSRKFAAQKRLQRSAKQTNSLICPRWAEGQAHSAALGLRFPTCQTRNASINRHRMAITIRVTAKEGSETLGPTPVSFFQEGLTLAQWVGADEHEYLKTNNKYRQLHLSKRLEDALIAETQAKQSTENESSLAGRRLRLPGLVTVMCWWTRSPPLPHNPGGDLLH